MVEILRKSRSKSFGLKNSQDFYCLSQNILVQHHVSLSGSHQFARESAPSCPVRRAAPSCCQSSTSAMWGCCGSRAGPSGTGPSGTGRGQGSMHVTHDGGGQAFVWSYLNPSSAQTAREAGKSSLARLI